MSPPPWRGSIGAYAVRPRGGVPAQAASTPDRADISQRASEVGAWWMIVQTACDQATARKLLDAMNAALVTMGNSDLQPIVAHRCDTR